MLAEALERDCAYVPAVAGGIRVSALAEAFSNQRFKQRRFGVVAWPDVRMSALTLARSSHGHGAVPSAFAIALMAR
ncbi:hypothetical protein [Streptomyces phaeoluteigriseus]|uniref:hypothetical protein n=1 Tax=Streptomyces phaeoluteigriseus TaxID=114686 RepID=UPI001180510D|nr:hypothetical protein [Streptomyces phaeoluteigriseus]